MHCLTSIKHKCSQVSGSEAMALDTACLSDILMQPLELFPISSCNSWALSGLPTLPSLQKMSIGAAGICSSQLLRVPYAACSACFCICRCRGSMIADMDWALLLCANTL